MPLYLRHRKLQFISIAIQSLFKILHWYFPRSMQPMAASLCSNLRHEACPLTHVQQGMGIQLYTKTLSSALMLCLPTGKTQFDITSKLEQWSPTHDLLNGKIFIMGWICRVRFNLSLPYYTEAPELEQFSQPPLFLGWSFNLTSLVNMRGAIAIDISSWKRSLHAYGMCTCQAALKFQNSTWKTLYQNRSQKTPSINFELTIFMGKYSGLLYILRSSSRTHLHNVCLILTASTLIGVFLQIGNCNKTTVFTHMDTICITLIK